MQKSNRKARYEKSHGGLAAWEEQRKGCVRVAQLPKKPYDNKAKYC
jgi:hypothetical protein